MTATPHTWLVVADGEHAVIYVRQRAERLVPMRAKSGATNDHYHTTQEWHLSPVRELKAEAEEHFELRGDDGDVFDSAGVGRHGTAPKEDLQTQRSKALMDNLAEMLNEAFAQQEFARLVLTAPPKLLGHLRTQLDKDVQGAVLAELPKNLSHASEAALVQVMSDALKATL